MAATESSTTTKTAAAAPTSKLTVAATFASGVIVGVVAAPYIKKALKEFAPALDQVSDKVARSAGKVFEKATDVMAEAKERLHQETKA